MGRRQSGSVSASFVAPRPPPIGEPVILSSNANSGGAVAYTAVLGPNALVSSPLSVNDSIQLPFVRGGSVDYLFVQIRNAPTTTPFVITLFVNGVASTLTASVAIGQLIAVDITHVIPIMSGDLLCWQLNDTDFAGRVRISARLVPF